MFATTFIQAGRGGRVAGDQFAAGVDLVLRRGVLAEGERVGEQAVSATKTGLP